MGKSTPACPILLGNPKLLDSFNSSSLPSADGLLPGLCCELLPKGLEDDGLDCVLLPKDGLDGVLLPKEGLDGVLPPENGLDGALPKEGLEGTLLLEEGLD